MTNTEPFVSLIIPSHNGGQDLLDCLRSVRSMDVQNLQVVLVDNGSTDGSAAKAKREFPNLNVVRLDQTSGYGKAVNIGIAHSKGCYVALLDSDTIVSPSWLSELVHTIETHSTIGVVGSKVYYHNTDKIYSAGGLLDSRNGFVHVLGLRSRDSAKFNRPRDVDWVAGCSILFRRDIVEKIGYIDEGYGFYREEVDLCQKARLLGYRVLFVPTSTVWHKVSTTVSKSGLKFYYLHRSWLRFVIIHSKGFYVVLGFLFATFFMLGESFADILRGYRASVRQAVSAVAWNAKSARSTLLSRMRRKQLEEEFGEGKSR